ncbi:whey acidic protein-like [Psammomys obesus]|uniref:whey acidic protein-like n=1 Tax=Psammomys obesus TaxID=48139 RepID=UPI002452AC31|nr:whey acidic protein-like [Psammomys obesus]
MRCFTGLILGLLALEVALAQNRQENVFNLVQSLCSKASISESTECINNQDKECAQNPMCCSGSCSGTCKTSINSPPCSLTPNLVPEVSGPPTVLPDNQRKDLSK